MKKLASPDDAHVESNATETTTCVTHEVVSQILISLFNRVSCFGARFEASALSRTVEMTHTAPSACVKICEMWCADFDVGDCVGLVTRLPSNQRQKDEEDFYATSLPKSYINHGEPACEVVGCSFGAVKKKNIYALSDSTERRGHIHKLTHKSVIKNTRPISR